jgi:hypothetical protein
MGLSMFFTAGVKRACIPQYEYTTLRNKLDHAGCSGGLVAKGNDEMMK